MTADTTISVTEAVFNAPEADLVLVTGTGKGTRTRTFDRQPEGLVFSSPLILTIVVDGMSDGQWELVATLDDGTEHTVWIELR
jgi:hypothetical protein